MKRAETRCSTMSSARRCRLLPRSELWRWWDIRPKSVRFSGVRFAEQAEQKGTGHAVLCARSSVETQQGQLLILNGDGPLLRASTLEKLLESASEPGLGGAILTTEV